MKKAAGKEINCDGDESDGDEEDEDEDDDDEDDDDDDDDEGEDMSQKKAPTDNEEGHA